jgi:hypothetical protein
LSVARHGLESRSATSEEIVETRSCAVRRVLPCHLSFLRWTSFRAVGSVLEELWLPLPRPKSELVATPSLTLALPAISVTENTRVERPSHEVLVPTARLNFKKRLPLNTRSFLRCLRLAGLTCPDSATPTGFLNLLTSCSSRSPTSLISCWLHSWVFTFEGFPSQVAVQMFRLARSTSTGPSSGSSSAVTPPIPVQGFRHPASPLPRPVLPGVRDPYLPWRSSPRGFSPSVWACVSSQRR